jgi:hypothetical protein
MRHWLFTVCSPRKRWRVNFTFCHVKNSSWRPQHPYYRCFLKSEKAVFRFNFSPSIFRVFSCPYRHVFLAQLKRSFNSLTKYRTLLLRPHPLLHSLFLLLHDLQKMSVGPNVCYFVEHNRLGNHLHPLCMTTTFILSKSMKYVHVFILRLPCSNFYRINCITNIFFLQHSMIPSSPHACSFQTTASKNHLYIHT